MRVRRLLVLGAVGAWGLGWGVSGALALRTLGIDVSHYQSDGSYGAINWTSVKADGLAFAWAKADEGRGGNDAWFTTNMAGGKNSGVLMGAYHFARPETNTGTAGAIAEADHFVSVAGAYMTAGYMRPVVDIETGGVNSAAGRAALSAWTNAFINEVVAKKGAAAEPLIYCNTNYAQTYLDGSVSGRDVWIANYSGSAQTGSPGTGVFPTWAFWQYTSSGGYGGIGNPNVDHDVAHGDMTFVQSFLIPEPGVVGVAVAGVIALLGCRDRRVRQGQNRGQMGRRL